MIPAQKSGVIRKAGVPRIPNHFTESNYLDSLPIETRLNGQKKIGFTPKKNRSKLFEGFWVVLSKIHSAPDCLVFHEISTKKKYVKLQLVVVKTMTISTGEINLTFYLRCVHRMMTFLLWKVCLEILDSGLIFPEKWPAFSHRS